MTQNLHLMTSICDSNTWHILIIYKHIMSQFTKNVHIKVLIYCERMKQIVYLLYKCLLLIV